MDTRCRLVMKSSTAEGRSDLDGGGKGYVGPSHLFGYWDSFILFHDHFISIFTYFCLSSLVFHFIILLLFPYVLSRSVADNARA